MRKLVVKGIALSIIFHSTHAMSQTIDSETSASKQSLDKASSDNHVDISSSLSKGKAVGESFINTQGRANENVVSSAEDAFGTSVGSESIGLYGSNSVRGFSPITAGNVRIEGLYFDQQGGLTNRIEAGSEVRIGSNALSDPFPSPTGVVDIALRDSTNTNLISARVPFGPYGSFGSQVDAKLSSSSHDISASLGAGVEQDKFSNGGSGRFVSLGVVPQWELGHDTKVVAFWGRTIAHDETAPPSYIPAYEGLPPRVERGKYTAPSWLLHDGYTDNSGIITKFAPGDWTLKLGLFRSLDYSSKSFSNIIGQIDRSEIARRTVYANPSSRFRSYSGEFRVSKKFDIGALKNLLLVSVRGRNVSNRYGGSDQIDLGTSDINKKVNYPQPEFEFDNQTNSEIDQYTNGLSYSLKIPRKFDLRLGIQRTHYEKEVTDGKSVNSVSATTSYLPSVAFSLKLPYQVSLFGNYSKGLEENGQAPSYANNRLEILPALITKQYVGGLSWQPVDYLNTVVDYFWIKKPYFNLDQDGYYINLGDETHRGLEFSVTGHIRSNLTLVAGAYYLEPDVTAQDNAQNVIGKRPVAQPKFLSQINANYSIPRSEHWSIDASATYTGRQPSNVSNSVYVGGYTTIDLGSRYQFSLGKASGTIRFLVQNITDHYAWLPLSSGAYEPLAQRSFSAYIAVDF